MSELHFGQDGHIQLIMGPMFSGKTTELLRRIRRYTIAKRSCLVIKYEKDERYSKEHAATHDNVTHKATATDRLFATRKLCDEVDVIGIDEGQFYPDLAEFCEEMANEGKIVIVAALDGTFQRKAFGQVLELIPLCESLSKLSAVCMLCHGSGAFTARISSDTQVELIGGTEKYVSTCRRCFSMPVSNKQRISPMKLAQQKRLHNDVAQDDQTGGDTAPKEMEESSDSDHSVSRKLTFNRDEVAAPQHLASPAM